MKETKKIIGTRRKTITMYYTVLVSRRDQSRFRKRDTLFGGESFARVLWPHAGYLEMMNGINIRFSFVYFHRYRRKVFNARSLL